MFRLKRGYSAELLFQLMFYTGSLVFFGFFYINHLYQKEQLQLFQLTIGYFFKSISINGGFSNWLGEFMTQFFILPYAGAAIITVLLFLLQLLTKKILLVLNAGGKFTVLSFLPAIGYWFLLLNDYYYLSGLIALILSLLAFLFYVNIKESKSRLFAGIILIPVTYWLAGGAFMVLTLNIIVAEISFILKSKGEKSIFRSLLSIVLFLSLAILVPVIVRQFLIVDTKLQSYLSDAFYKIWIFFPPPLVIVFASTPLIIVLQQLLPAKADSKQRSSGGLILPVALTLLTILGLVFFTDSSAENEIAYENMVLNEEWDKIIMKAEKEQPVSPVSVFALNLALSETGQLSSKMFRFSQNRKSLFPEYERKGMTPFIASDTYYYLGLINFAQMFAMETIESTPDARYPARSWKRVAETFLINGQYESARKYLIPLSHTLFYRKWAGKCISCLYNEEKINGDPVWGQRRKMASAYDFYYNNQQMDIALRYLMISNPGNRVAFEYLMANYLLRKDFDGFLQYLPLAEKLNYNELPLAWQEASAYILTRLPKMPPQLERYALNVNVGNNLKAYAKLFMSDNRDTMKIKTDFGKTYWYYLHFK